MDLLKVQSRSTKNPGDMPGVFMIVFDTNEALNLRYEALSASAPPTISRISLVIAA